MAKAPAGWYPDDPSSPDQLRYWDGDAWTRHFSPERSDAAPDDRAAEAPDSEAATPARQTVVGRPAAPAWLTSWPAIIGGLLCLGIPGVVLAWSRPGPRLTPRLVSTAAGLVVFFVQIGLMGSAPVEPSVVAVTSTPEPSVSISFLALPQTTVTATPSPTPASIEEPIGFVSVPEEPAEPQEPPAPATDPHFGTCREAIANGYGDYVKGKDPEYDWYRDADSDGIVCER